MNTTKQMRQGRLQDPGMVKMLFGICWAAYFTTYLGRLNYSACMVEIMNSEGWSKGAAGLVATGFFVAYGVGQLINGFAGDKFSPKVMVAVGLGASGAVNLLFPLFGNAKMGLILWCVNGFVQSMVWSPLIRLVSEWMPPQQRMKACVNLNSTVPAGTLVAYGMSAALVYLGSWKLAFYSSGIILLVVSVFWMRGIDRVQNALEPVEAQNEVPEIGQPAQRPSLWKLALAGSVPICCTALVMQGILKDGVTTWIPTFLEEQFNLPTAGAILSTTLVPIINLSGVYLASWLDKRLFKNELISSALLFLTSTAALLVLVMMPMSSAALSLLLLAFTTTFMMGVNTMLVGVLPSYYARFGVCSSMSGILNASAYVGCSISSYGSGVIAERFGWNGIILVWLICALTGTLLCTLVARPWKRFRMEREKADQLVLSNS